MTEPRLVTDAEAEGWQHRAERIPGDRSIGNAAVMRDLLETRKVLIEALERLLHGLDVEIGDTIDQAKPLDPIDRAYADARTLLARLHEGETP